jgi:hypothetical protein
VSVCGFEREGTGVRRHPRLSHPGTLGTSLLQCSRSCPRRRRRSSCATVSRRS